MFANLKKKVQIEDPQFKPSEPNNLQSAAIHHKPTSKAIGHKNDDDISEDSKISYINKNDLIVELSNNNANSIKSEKSDHQNISNSDVEQPSELIAINSHFHTNSEICSNCQKLLDEKKCIEVSLKEIETKLKKSEEYSSFLTKDIVNMKEHIKQLELSSNESKNQCLGFIKDKNDLITEIDVLKEMLLSEKQSNLNLNNLLNKKDQEIIDLKLQTKEERNTFEELSSKIEVLESHKVNILRNEEEYNKLIASVGNLEQQIADKNKAIKKQEHLINDLRKTIQKEYNSKSTQPSIHSSAQSLKTQIYQSESDSRLLVEDNSKNKILSLKTRKDAIQLNEMNFKYLRHVVLKFMLCRETEALQLIKAISVLLNFTDEEQKLLRETLEWRMSWFGSRPQFTQIIQPS